MHQIVLESQAIWLVDLVARPLRPVTSKGVVTTLAPRYFGRGGFIIEGVNPVLAESACSKGVQLTSEVYPDATGMFFQTEPLLATANNAYTVSAWLNIANTNIPSQIFWSTMEQVEINYGFYWDVPPTGAPLSCSFSVLNTTCQFYNSDVVVDPIPSGVNVYFAVTERDIANNTEGCSNWAVYYNAQLQVPRQCTPQTRAVTPVSNFVSFAMLPPSQFSIWNAIVSDLTMIGRAVTPNELYRLSKL